MTARLLATLSLVDGDDQKVRRFLVEKVVPMLSDNSKKQGAIEAVGCVIDRLGMAIVPLIGVLTVPVMRRMTDQDASVRLMASQCFGTLVRLLPLVSADSISQKPLWMVQGQEDAEFLEQLLDAKKMRECVVPVPIEAQLRSYQQVRMAKCEITMFGRVQIFLIGLILFLSSYRFLQDGLNWLDFLNRYNLHGILCDDMGLGKTLQTICILACDHYRISRKKQQVILLKQSPFSFLRWIIILNYYFWLCYF